MGKIRVELKANARTGRKKVVVYYESDPSLTYQEHLKRHHEILEQLLSLQVIRAEELGDIEFRVVEPQSGQTLMERAPQQEREITEEKA